MRGVKGSAAVTLCCCGCGQTTGRQAYYVMEHKYLMQTVPVRERVESRIAVAGPDDCWLWTGTKNQAGYGVTAERGKHRHAHRLAYEYANGAIPDGLIVRHKCDNPPCCNPSHLELGTHDDNSKDKVSRKRHQFGEKSYQARLTEKDVRDIRLAAALGATVKPLADAYGVSEGAIAGVVHRRTWKHVEDAA